MLIFSNFDSEITGVWFDGRVWLLKVLVFYRISMIAWDVTKFWAHLAYIREFFWRRTPLGGGKLYQVSKKVSVMCGTPLFRKILVKIHKIRGFLKNISATVPINKMFVRYKCNCLQRLIILTNIPNYNSFIKTGFMA